MKVWEQLPEKEEKQSAVPKYLQGDVPTGISKKLFSRYLSAWSSPKRHESKKSELTEQCVTNRNEQCIFCLGGILMFRSIFISGANLHNHELAERSMPTYKNYYANESACRHTMNATRSTSLMHSLSQLRFKIKSFVSNIQGNNIKGR